MVETDGRQGEVDRGGGRHRRGRHGRTQAAVSWGLKLYPLPNQCAVPDGASVPVAANNHGRRHEVHQRQPGRGERRFDTHPRGASTRGSLP